MTVSDKGLMFIAEFEGFVGHPYLDAVGVPTIGFGSTLYENGTAVTMKDAPITKERAMLCMRHHIENRIDGYLAKFTLNQAQYDSLVSFCYNLGTGALDQSSLKKSILAKAPSAEIEANFEKWCKAGGKVLPGLLARRKREAKLFNTGIYI